MEHAWEGLSRPLRRLAALVVLSVLALLAGCGSRVELVSGLGEADANEVLGALLNASIKAEKVSKKAGVSVEVDSDRVLTAIDVLERNGLPRTRRTRMGDIFKKENLISSPLEERARYLYALSQELEDTLLKIDGVVAARVHIVLPERLVPGEAPMPSSASVFIKHQHQVPLEPIVPKITNLVTTSIPGLADKKVTVVLVESRPMVGEQAREQQSERVWFYDVQKDSAPGLRTLLVALAAVAGIGLFAGALGLWSNRGALASALKPGGRTRGRKAEAAMAAR